MDREIDVHKKQIVVKKKNIFCSELIFDLTISYVSVNHEIYLEICTDFFFLILFLFEYMYSTWIKNIVYFHEINDNIDFNCEIFNSIKWEYWNKRILFQWKVWNKKFQFLIETQIYLN